MEEHSALEVLSALVGQAAQPVAVGFVHRSGGLDLDTPRLAASGQDKVNLDLVRVALVPEAQVGISPTGLGHQLLDYE